MDRRSRFLFGVMVGTGFIIFAMSLHTTIDFLNYGVMLTCLAIIVFFTLLVEILGRSTLSKDMVEIMLGMSVSLGILAIFIESHLPMKAYYFPIMLILWIILGIEVILYKTIK